MMVLLAAGLSRALSSNTLSPPALRGQLIYRKGESASDRPITAVVGSSEIQAKLIPCASCHGRDGRGRPEGSVVPPSIRWEDLIRPRRIALGGERIPYNERLLIRAITMGFDPQGKPLNVAMPRYALSQADAQDLIAYLKALSADYDPGLTDDIVRIGALLPPNSRYPGQAAAIQSALMGYFSDLNKGGGLYGRKIELICRELPPEPNQVAETYQEFLQKNQVFALLASYMAGARKTNYGTSRRRTGSANRRVDPPSGSQIILKLTPVLSRLRTSWTIGISGRVCTGRVRENRRKTRICKLRR